jgi:hypothetical protein
VKIRGGIPSSFGIRYDADGTQHPYVVGTCKCGAHRDQPTGGVSLPHATIVDGEREMRPGFMDAAR